jgi:4-hydroxyacetophenone monooxygenase
MTLARPVEAITADDDTIRAALDAADLPALLPALAYVTGDLSLLRDDLRIDPALMMEEQGGLTEEQQAAVRALAFETLKRFRDEGLVPHPVPQDTDLFERILAFMAGGIPSADYLPMMEEELALEDDVRAAHWKKADVAPDRDFRVAIIGSGMSGIVAAYRLQQAGIAYTVLDKNPDVGGTWLENTYPGCRVDIPNHYYSYSFAQRDDWPLFYSPRSELHRYFRECVDEFGIRPNIRFETEVTSVHWDEGAKRWTLELAGPEGESTLEADAVVSAVGQLNRPQYPNIAGRDDFAGPSFHSAEWDHSVDLKGKRVGVIGTGCSSAQFVPIIAEDVAALEIFQRTPNWFFPMPHYHEEVPEGLQWLFRHVPFYRQWYRFWLFWRGAETLRPMAEVDPEWPHQERSVSELNDQLRALLTEAIEAQYPDHPELLAKVLPSYPPAAKRIIVDNGVWATALKRDNVTLTTDGIERITAEGVVTTDGELHRFDVLIYATGFQPSRFLMPMKVVGRGGVDLHSRWDGDARAYLGITVPGFPNFFIMYGPNTNIVVNGSIIWFSECEAHYIMDYLRTLFVTGAAALDVREDVHDAYNQAVDAENLRMVWGVADVNSWYKNAKGRVAQNWPFPLVEYWKRTHAIDPADYETL